MTKREERVVRTTEQYCEEYDICAESLYVWMYRHENAMAVAEMLHKEATGSSNMERWGYIYHGSIQSKLFPVLNPDNFYDMFCSAFPLTQISKKQFTKSIYEVKKSLQVRKTELDTPRHRDNRNEVKKVTDNLNRLFEESENR